MITVAFDISSLLYRTFYSYKGESEDTIAGMATHQALITLNKYFKMFKPNVVVMAFDRHSWRKDYTASDKCISKKPYKGNRRLDLTPSEQVKYQKFINHMQEFEQLITSHTTIVTLAQDQLEADDLIAGYCQHHTDPDNEIIVISTDSDLLQLVRQQNVKVFSPQTDNYQSLAKFKNDPEYYTFVKCIRGDRTDNIQSAFPRVRETKLESAYKDPYAMTELMKSTWVNENKQTFIVEDLYNENKILINLTAQPENIRQLIDNTVAQSIEKQRKFSLFHIMKFIGKHELKKIQDSIDQYIPLLSA